MYGILQIGRIAYDNLIKYLEVRNYVPTGQTPGLFEHQTKPIYFCLVIDDFGVKYTNHNDVIHFINHLSKEYKCTIDCEGKLYLRITLD